MTYTDSTRTEKKILMVPKDLTHAGEIIRDLFDKIILYAGKILKPEIHKYERLPDTQDFHTKNHIYFIYNTAIGLKTSLLSNRAIFPRDIEYNGIYVLWVTVPLVSRGFLYDLIQRLKSSRVIFFYSDSNFAEEIKVLGLLGSNHSLIPNVSAVVLPGILDPGKSFKFPEILKVNYIAGFKLTDKDLTEISFYLKSQPRLGRLAYSYATKSGAPSILELSKVINKSPNDIFEDAKLRSFVGLLYKLRGDQARIAIIKQLIKFPCRIVTNRRLPDEIFLNRHPEVDFIFTGLEYSAAFNGINPGDGVVFHPVWSTDSIETERYASALVRCGVPIIPTSSQRCSISPEFTLDYDHSSDADLQRCLEIYFSSRQKIVSLSDSLADVSSRSASFYTVERMCDQMIEGLKVLSNH